MASDDDRDIDVESDDADDSDNRQSNMMLPSAGNQYYSQAEKRAHHNALERKRRDHIKDSFSSLRDTVPALNGEKASRAQILKKAAEYIMHMRKKNLSHQKNISDLARQNGLLEKQVNRLEMLKATGSFNTGGSTSTSKTVKIVSDHTSNCESELNNSDEEPVQRRKKRAKSPRN